MSNNNLFPNLARGNSVKIYLGIQDEQGPDTFSFGHDYSYLQVQLAESSKKTVQPGDWVVLKAAITVDPRKCRIQVVPSGVLAAIGLISCQTIIEPGEGPMLAVTLKAEREFDLTNLPYFVRLYGIF